MILVFAKLAERPWLARLVEFLGTHEKPRPEGTPFVLSRVHVPERIELSVLGDVARPSEFADSAMMDRGTMDEDFTFRRLHPRRHAGTRRGGDRPVPVLGLPAVRADDQLGCGDHEAISGGVGSRSGVGNGGAVADLTGGCRGDEEGRAAPTSGREGGARRCSDWVWDDTDDA
jgi:hypothetical protein